ncbi:phosphotransferase family protein [Rhodococcus ruber]|uniref:Phosphotransferase family protein n=1 Tax=Rhodococcus ruber TaxID=1830 RepID=A0ABT4MES5_9NOCA|nr:phosphotransferase family protein [Rhodococcus ruber]MCZ4519482.1 phosphotransferase family protein [Rhodococcus ruber]
MSTYEIADDPEIADVRPGDEQNWDNLKEYLSGILEVPADAAMEVHQFPNGSANLTFHVVLGETRVVVRRPPRGEIPAGAHDMGREYRVLSRLWQEYPRAPRALGYCEDTTVLGAPFLTTEYRGGAVIRNELPGPMRTILGAGSSVSEAFARAVADLHLVDPAKCGLTGLGRPEGFTARQVRGWRARWEASRPNDDVPVMDELGERFAADIPDPVRVSLVHSDLKLDNCQFRPADPTRVVTVFDWDMTTLGDPLIDLGTALSYWPEAGDAGEAARALWPGQENMGLWTRAHLRDRYAQLTGFDVSRLAWYEAFGSWKTAIALQQLTNRASTGQSSDPRLGAYADIVPIAARAAAETLSI